MKTALNSKKKIIITLWSRYHKTENRRTWQSLESWATKKLIGPSSLAQQTKCNWLNKMGNHDRLQHILNEMGLSQRFCGSHSATDFSITFFFSSFLWMKIFSSFYYVLLFWSIRFYTSLFFSVSGNFLFILLLNMSFFLSFLWRLKIFFFKIVSYSNKMRMKTA